MGAFNFKFVSKEFRLKYKIKRNHDLFGKRNRGEPSPIRCSLAKMVGPQRYASWKKVPMISGSFGETTSAADEGC